MINPVPSSKLLKYPQGNILYHTQKSKQLICKKCFQPFISTGTYGLCKKCKTRTCRVCKKEFLIIQLTDKWGFYCGKKCRYLDHGKKLTGLSGEKNYYWKGGRQKRGVGYIAIYKPSHPTSDKKGYILEHRYVMENHIKRNLTRNEQVHHRNGIKDDNRIENLEIIIQKTHKGYVDCPHCLKKFAIR